MELPGRAVGRLEVVRAVILYPGYGPYHPGNESKALPTTYHNCKTCKVMFIENFHQKAEVMILTICLKSDDVSNTEIKDEKFRVWEPEGVSVRGFLLRDSARENRTCVNMAKPPKPFTYELQDRERARFRLGAV
ncbi:KICSTOR complex protein szt2 [Branchiostoma belcheri]|nr:KICSTOR complex protein szt2 [Branchiostoma belcheri]